MIFSLSRWWTQTVSILEITGLVWLDRTWIEILILRIYKPSPKFNLFNGRLDRSGRLIKSNIYWICTAIPPGRIYLHTEKNVKSVQNSICIQEFFPNFSMTPYLHFVSIIVSLGIRVRKKMQLESTSRISINSLVSLLNNLTVSYKMVQLGYKTGGILELHWLIASWNMPA